MSPRAGQAIPADKYFRSNPALVVDKHNPQDNSNLIDNANLLRGRPLARRHGAFKNSYKRSGPEVAEGNSNS